MEMTLICGYCKKETSFPELSKDGRKVKCGKCGKWQTFKGTMEVPIQLNGIIRINKKGDKK